MFSAVVLPTQKLKADADIFNESYDIYFLTNKLDHFMPMVLIVYLRFYSCQRGTAFETDHGTLKLQWNPGKYQ